MGYILTIVLRIYTYYILKTNFKYPILMLISSYTSYLTTSDLHGIYVLQHSTHVLIRFCWQWNYLQWFLIISWLFVFLLQLIECPSVYELLASPDFPWDDPPELRLWRKQEDGKSVKLERYGPKDYIGIMNQALEGNTVWSFVPCTSIISIRRLFRVLLYSS